MTASATSNPSEPRDSYDSSCTESDHQGTRFSSSGEFYIRQHSRSVSWAADEPSTDAYDDQHMTSSSSSEDWRQHELGRSHDGANDTAAGGPSMNRFTSSTTLVGSTNILRSDPGLAAKRYNALASVNELAAFGVVQDYMSHIIQLPDEPQISMLGKIVQGAKKKVVRSVSYGDLKKSSTSLAGLCERGGCARLKLPAEFSPSESLIIPFCLAATGSYIVKNAGPLIPGIFREEGSGTEVAQLLEHYAAHSPRSRHTNQGNQLPSKSPSKLPWNSKATVLEVATAYKRVIRDLPGGLLGSLNLLEALRDISFNLNRDGLLSESVETELRVHLIALALSCVHSDDRFSVICATLGLYAWIGHAAEASPGGRELNDKKDGITKGSQPRPDQVDIMKANNQAGIAIASMLITNWREIVKALRNFAANAAAILRHEEKKQRLANAKSMSTLPKSSDPVQEQQPPEVLNKPAAAGNRGKFKRVALKVPKGIVALSKDNVYKGNTRKATDSDIPVAFGTEKSVQDGTGGYKRVNKLYGANDGHKTRAATYRRTKRTKSQRGAGFSMRSRRPGPKRHSSVASGPTVYKVRGRGHTNDVERDQTEPEDSRQLSANYTPRQRRHGPTYETQDQPEDDFLDEDIPSEERLSDYEDLPPSEPSQSERGAIELGDRIRDGDGFDANDIFHYDENSLFHQSFVTWPMYREVYNRLEEMRRDDRTNQARSIEDVEDLASYDQRPAQDAMEQPPSTTIPTAAVDHMTVIDEPNHPVQSSVDIEALAQAQAQVSAISRSTPRRRGEAPFGSSNEVDAITGATGSGHEQAQFTHNEAFAPNHARSQTANSVTSSQSGSVRQIAQRFEQQSQGHYVPPWMNVGSSSKQIHKKAIPTKPAAEAKAPPVTSYNDSYYDLPHVENFEDTPTPRAQATTSSNLPTVNSLENTPTPRARSSLIPKPLSEIGMPRKRSERSNPPSAHHFQNYPAPLNVIQRRPPPIYQAPRPRTPPQHVMSGALGPDDVPPNRSPSPIRAPDSPSPFYDPLSAGKVEPLSWRMTRRNSSLRSSIQQLDQSVIDSIPTRRPMTLDGDEDANTFFTHHHPHGPPLRSDATSSQNGDPSSASEYSDHPDDEQPADPARLQADLKHEQRLREERYLTKLMEEYEEWQVGKQACHYKLTGRLSMHSIRTMTSQDFINNHDWDVEEMGPAPRMKSRYERRMDDDTDFIVRGRRPFDVFPEIEARERAKMQPWIDRVREVRGPVKDGVEEREAFKKKIEACQEWAKGAVERLEAEEAQGAEKRKWLEEKKREREWFEGLGEEEQRAWVERKKGEKLERICRMADEKQEREKRAKKGKGRWSRKSKSGSSGGAEKAGTRGGGASGSKVSVLKRIFGGGGLRKGGGV
ncbi:MAG: hypothetical protein Q9195_002417 [Heterodermia aff. obscurata]